MRKTKIGVMDFHGSVDITDPCYDKDVWCRMNNVKISEGEYACYVWRHTDKGKYEDGTPYSYLLVGAIGIYRNGDIPRQKDMEEIGSIGVDAGLAGFFHNKPDYSDEEWGRFCDRVRNGDACPRIPVQSAFLRPAAVLWSACCRLFRQRSDNRFSYSRHRTDEHPEKSASPGCRHGCNAPAFR